MAHDPRFNRELCQVLATLCSLQIDFVLEALAVPEDQRYRTIYISKKRGGKRVLHEPCEALKVVQGAILPWLHRRYKLEQRFFGYMPGRSPVDNARYHIWYWRGEAHLPESMFHVDLKDAFPSARDVRLTKMFTKMFSPKKFLRLAGESMNKAIVLHRQFIELLLYLTTYEQCLPQGAPTSPYLLNMLIGHMGILKQVDRELSGRSYKISIYADDITVSAPGWMSWRMRRGILTAINRTGFRVNRDKTRFNVKSHKAHCVTGVSLTLDDKGIPKLTLCQKTRNKWRRDIHYATLALEQGREPTFEDDGVTLDEAHGYSGWIRKVYEKHELPSDIGIPLTDFAIAYATYKSTKKERW